MCSTKSRKPGGLLSPLEVAALDGTYHLDYLPRVLRTVRKQGRDAVKPPYRSVAVIMAVVAGVALNLAVGRALFAYNPALVLGVCLTGPAVQLAGVVSARCRERGRLFWVGFLVFGSLAMASFIWAMVFAPNVGIARDPVTGGVKQVTIPGSFMWTVWSSYIDAAGSLLAERLRFGALPPALTAALIISAPQFLAALVGGLLARQVAYRYGKGPNKVVRAAHNTAARSPSAKLQPVKP